MSETLYEELTDNGDPIVIARKLSEDVQNTYFDIGCILYHVKEGDLYKTLENNKYYSEDHSKWRNFLEDYYTPSYRTLQYWVNLYRYFTDMGKGKEDLISIGWSKAKELIDFTDDVNKLEDAMKLAETGTIKQLQMYIAEVKKGTEKSGEDLRESVEFKKFTFKFFDAAGETVDQILETAMKDTDGDKNSALFKICIEWYQNRLIENTTVNVDDVVTTYDVEEEGLQEAGLA